MGDGVEHEVQALARQIAAAGASERAHLFHLGRWSERVLDWAMSHPGFKTELFRFVDVFPACRDDADVLRHLSEYFALGALWRAGEACTVDLLGEKTVTEREAARYAERVRATLEALVAGTRDWPAEPRLERDPWGPVPRVNVSVKPTALSPLFAPASAPEGLAEARERLLPILRRAREAGATVHLDMEHDDVKDLTLELLRTLGAEFPAGPPLGCVIQAYRKDAFADLREVVAWSERALRLPLAVRLVKGAYWDFETVVATAEGWPVPVFEAKAETDANYERCVRHLVEHAGRVRPAFGSHNLRSIAYAIAYGRSRGLPAAALEHQLLYGMAEPIHAALSRLGFRVRVYAPVGDLVAGMAYLVRRLLENTSNESFIRHRFAEGQALEALIAPPAVERQTQPPEAAERRATDPADPGPFANEPHAELRRPHARRAAPPARPRAPARRGPGGARALRVRGAGPDRRAPRPDGGGDRLRRSGPDLHGRLPERPGRAGRGRARPRGRGARVARLAHDAVGRPCRRPLPCRGAHAAAARRAGRARGVRGRKADRGGRRRRVRGDRLLRVLRARGAPHGCRRAGPLATG